MYYITIHFTIEKIYNKKIDLYVYNIFKKYRKLIIVN